MSDTNATTGTVTPPAAVGSAPAPPNVPRQLLAMAVRYGIVTVAGWFVRKGIMEQSQEGPFVDVATGFFVFLAIFLWGWLVKEGQRRHWWDALYADAPGPRQIVIQPPTISTDETVKAAAIGEAVRAATLPPGVGL